MLVFRALTTVGQLSCPLLFLLQKAATQHRVELDLAKMCERILLPPWLSPHPIVTLLDIWLVSYMDNCVLTSQCLAVGHNIYYYLQQSE